MEPGAEERSEGKEEGEGAGRGGGGVRSQGCSGGAGTWY